MANSQGSSKHLTIGLRVTIGMLVWLGITAHAEAAALAQGEFITGNALVPTAGNHQNDGLRFVVGSEKALMLPSAGGALNPRTLPEAGMTGKLGPLRDASGVVPPQVPDPKKVIYLTFDDGPSKTWTPQVLSLLARYHAHATFFVVGQDARAYPGIIKAIVAGGHLIGNHTYDHAWLGRMTKAQVAVELARTQKVLGSVAASCMRPPYGSTNRFTRAEAAQLGMKLVLWDIDPRDWSRPGAPQIASRILAQASPGATVLLHDGGSNRAQTVAALAIVLRKLSQRGYRFETQPACRHNPSR